MVEIFSEISTTRQQEIIAQILHCINFDGIIQPMEEVQRILNYLHSLPQNEQEFGDLVLQILFEAIGK